MYFQFYFFGLICTHGSFRLKQQPGCDNKILKVNLKSDNDCQQQPI